MTLNDEDIKNGVVGTKLIDPFHEGNLQNCRYNLRAGKVFMPETGDELFLKEGTQYVNGTAAVLRPMHWCIKPSDTLVVMTEETVNIPSDLYATYGPLNSLAQKGLLLINASIIEPGYKGPLSCCFVNFSSKPVLISQGAEIVKICFHQLTNKPKDLKELVISSEKYAGDLSASASSFPKSFLNIGGLEARVVEAATKSVRTSITLGGVIILVLALFNTLEPFLNKFVWDKAGVVSNSSRAEIQAIKVQLEQQQKELAAERQRMEAEDTLRREHYDKMVLELQQAAKKTGK